MTAPAAIKGTYADLKTVKTRSVVQIVIEAPIEMGEEIVRAFGFPQPGREISVAVARLNPEKTAKSEKTPRLWSELSYAEQAGIRCGEVAFRKFLARDSEEIAVLDLDMAADDVRHHCGVRSRSEIIPGSKAAERWHDLEIEYQNWLRGEAA